MIDLPFLYRYPLAAIPFAPQNSLFIRQNLYTAPNSDY